MIFEEIQKKTMILFVGAQASGKSTFYKTYFAGRCQHINLDTLHTRNKENIMLSECLQNSECCVIDNTNPTKKDREKYIRLAQEYGYHIIGFYFKSCISECLMRNAKREGKAYVPERAILGTAKRLELPEYSEGFEKLYHVAIAEDEFVIKDWEGEQDEI